MIKTSMIAAGLVGALMAAGCASTEAPSLANFLPASSPITTSALPDKAPGVVGTPVSAERPARLYVYAAFMEKDCSPIGANVTIATPPSKGTVTFRENQETVIQSSLSGKCIGQRVTGTGVYYTAQKGQDGADTFTVTATSPNGEPVTRTFQVRIVDRAGG